jgi:hypothetical protein
MRSTPFLPVLLGGLLLIVGCDAPQDASTKEVVAPGTQTASNDSAIVEEGMEDVNGTEDHDHEDGHTAEDDHDHENEGGGRLEAHVHGHATLAAALDGNELTFTFEAPLASLVGFEHEPQTEEQVAALEALKDVYVVPGAMVAVNASANCLPVMTTSGTHLSGDHGALEAEHVYTCNDPSKIETVEFLLMGDYPALESIDAVFLSDTGQSAAELTPGNPSLKVR